MKYIMMIVIIYSLIFSERPCESFQSSAWLVTFINNRVLSIIDGLIELKEMFQMEFEMLMIFGGKKIGFDFFHISYFKFL